MISSPASKTTMPMSLQTTLVPSLEGIDLAGRLLELNLKNDHSFPGLSDQLKHGESKSACVSNIFSGIHQFVYSLWS